jgi:hypothetical protein
MSNEKPDEFLSWRGRLGQPDALPEQGLDNPEATWERLNARLGETRPGESARSGGIVPDRKTTAGKHRHRVYRYGIAVAFLLLALIPAARLYRDWPSAGKQISPPVGKQASGTEVPGAEVPSARISGEGLAGGQASGVIRQPANMDREGIAGTIISGARPDKHLPLKEALSRVSRLTGSGRRERKTGSVTLSAIADRQGRVEGVALADSGTRLAVFTPPVKKALRVVSIHEIDNPTATAPAITVHWPSIPLRVHLVPRRNDVSPVTADQVPPVLLKIKLNPQNP